MGTFITYDWAAIEEALEAGNTAPIEERRALVKLFDAYNKRKEDERLAGERQDRLDAMKRAELNTPVYFIGSDDRLFATNVEWMLKTGDARTNMKVDVKEKGRAARTWRIPYAVLSLDWRRQTGSVHKAGGIAFLHKVSTQPW